MWSPPSPSFVKINFDGSVNGTSAAGGFVIRDEFGRPLAAAARFAGKSSVPTAEARALRDSLKFALEKGYSKIEVEGDSKIVIGAITGSMKIPWRLTSLVKDI